MKLFSRICLGLPCFLVALYIAIMQIAGVMPCTGGLLLLKLMLGMVFITALLSGETR